MYLVRRLPSPVLLVLLLLTAVFVVAVVAVVVAVVVAAVAVRLAEALLDEVVLLHQLPLLRDLLLRTHLKFSRQARELRLEFLVLALRLPRE